jgi:hypothetical protein
MTDPNHCGRCGHSCFGGACNNGTCAPRAIGTQLSPIGDLVLTDDAIFLSSFQLQKVFGCTLPCLDGVTTLGEGRGGVIGIAADATAVYFTDWGGGAQSGIRKCLLPGCEGGPQDVASGITRPNRIVLSGGRVYWASSETGSFGSVATSHSGAAPPAFLTGESAVAAITATADRLYWGRFGPQNTNGGSIRTCATPDCTGGAQTLVEGLDSPRKVAVAGSTLLWTNSSAVMQCDLPACSGGPSQLVGGLKSPNGLAVRGNRAFWAAVDGVYTCDLPACDTPRMLAPNPPETRTGIAGRLATNGAAVVWDNANGTILLVAAP